MKQNQSLKAFIFFAFHMIKLYQLGRKEVMEQLWTGLQPNELESITEICGNSRLFEYRATSIEPQPQRSLYLFFPLPKDKAKHFPALIATGKGRQRKTAKR